MSSRPAWSKKKAQGQSGLLHTETLSKKKKKKKRGRERERKTESEKGRERKGELTSYVSFVSSQKTQVRFLAPISGTLTITCNFSSKRSGALFCPLKGLRPHGLNSHRLHISKK